MNTILHKIKTYVPNESISFRKHPHTGNVEVVFHSINAVITILDTNWDEIKRHIDAKFNMNKDISCSICLEDMKSKRVSCSKCANYWCIPCYINIFKTNRGIIKCPYCRFEYGQLHSDEALELGIQEILIKADM
jgi:hypothetical protein